MASLLERDMLRSRRNGQSRVHEGVKEWAEVGGFRVEVVCFLISGNVGGLRAEACLVGFLSDEG